MSTELIQGTDEWLAMRKNYIGASDASAIMGVSPWTTPYMVWCDKMGLSNSKPVNDAMKRGNDLEPIAREQIENELGLVLKPKVKFHKSITYMMASLDGLSEDGSFLVEIKCPGSIDHASAMDGVIPEKYIPQLQHQLEVCGLDTMYYFSFDGKYGKMLEISKDIKYVNNLIEKEKQFWDCVLNFEPPHLSDKDYLTRSDTIWDQAATTYIDINEQFKSLETKREYARKRLISLSSGQNTQGSNVRLSRIVRKGNIDYLSIPELKDVDLEAYRREAVESWRIT